jgi:hypothetical protein
VGGLIDTISPLWIDFTHFVQRTLENRRNVEGSDLSARIPLETCIESSYRTLLDNFVSLPHIIRTLRPLVHHEIAS